MYAFLVLGLIPGTNIQITFQGWIYMIMLVFVVAAFILMRSRQSRSREAVVKVAARRAPATRQRRRAQ